MAGTNGAPGSIGVGLGVGLGFRGMGKRIRIFWLASVSATALLAVVQGSSQSDSSLQLQARVLGEGRPVVLLGGGLLGADGWGEVPRVLARTRRVINLQSLVVQYGLEDRDLPAGYSLHTEVDALRRTLEAIGVENSDIIGMSHGGVVAIAFAVGGPHRVRTLTLIEPPRILVTAQPRRR